MAKLAIFLAIIGFAYWYWSYWSERYQESTQTLEATLEAHWLQDNAAIMQRCIKKEERMQATGGLTGLGNVGSSGWDAERLCAEKNNLYLRDGKWYSKQD